LEKRNTMPICLNCPTEFTPKNPKGKFCSTKCRVAYSRKKAQPGVEHIGYTQVIEPVKVQTDIPVEEMDLQRGLQINIPSPLPGKVETKKPKTLREILAGEGYIAAEKPKAYVPKVK